MNETNRSALIYLLYAVLLIVTTLFQLFNIENGFAGIFIIIASFFAAFFSIRFISIAVRLLSLQYSKNYGKDLTEETKLIKESGKVMFVITTIWFGFNLLGVILHAIAYFI